MVLSRLFILLVLLLSGCGGSDSGTPPVNQSARFSLSISTVNFYGVEGGYTPYHEYVMGNVSGADSTVYIVIELESNNLIQDASVVLYGISGELTLTPQSPDNVPAGINSEIITVKACNDAACNSQIQGSPQTIKVTYEVTPLDTDNDGIPNSLDDNDDNDSLLDNEDDYPLDMTMGKAETTFIVNIQGEGQVTVNEETFSCDNDCSFTYINNNEDRGAIINVNAIAAENYQVASWQYSTECQYLACNFETSHIEDITANFEFSKNANVPVNISSSIGGGVFEDLGAIQCADNCEENLYNPREGNYQFSAIPLPGYAFTGWTGDCSGTNACEVPSVEGNTITLHANFSLDNALTEFNLCPGDDDSFSGEGVVSIGNSSGFIPLCNGYVIHSDIDNNQIIVKNIITNTVTHTFQLTHKPDRLALDEENKLLYITHGISDYLTRVDLNSGLVSAIYSAGDVNSIAINNTGYVFIGAGKDYTKIVDSASGMLLRETNIYEDSITYNDATNRLITSSGNYWFDSSTLSLTQQANSHVSYGSGANCNYVYVSPDGEHAARPCGGGSGQGYTVYNVYSHNTNTIFGEWDTGSYPSVAAFSPSSKYILLTDTYDEMQLFNVTTHQLVTTKTFNSCNNAWATQLAISTDEKLLYAQTGCNTDQYIEWKAYNTQ